MDAEIRTKALQGLNLSQEENLSVYGADIRKKYIDALKFGNIRCIYHKIMLLGDSGVGKTSTRKLLMGESHAYKDGQSTFGIERHFVDEKFAKADSDEMNSETERAASYFAIFGKSNLLSNVATPIYVIIVNCILLLLVFLVTGLIIYVLFFYDGLRTGFTPVLVLATLPISVVMRDGIEGFNMGSGLAVILVMINFVITVQLPQFTAIISFHESFNCATMSILYYVSKTSITVAAISASLGSGGRAGMSIAFCTLVPPMYQPVQNSTNEKREMEWKLLKLVTLIVVFMSAIVVQSHYTKTGKRNIICVCVLVSSIACLSITASLKIKSDMLVICSVGAIYGICFIRGLCQGHQLRKKMLGSRLLASVFGWEIGMLGAHFFGWKFSSSTLINDCWFSVAAVLGCTIAIAAEIRRWYYIYSNPLPVDLIWKMKSCNLKTWPRRLCLLDCSGNELYHIGHHIFMAKHCIYIIVFSLEDAYERPEWQKQRLLYWFNSVFGHIHHRDALVFLVGTHKASLNERRKRQVEALLWQTFFHSFGARLALNSKKTNCLSYAVENRYRTPNDSELSDLKEAIQMKCAEAEFSKRPIPIKWSRFHDYIKKQRSLGAQHCIADYNELWVKMKNYVGFKEEAEFLRMLEFYNDYGEIFFRSHKARLFRMVVLDPQILVDSVEALAGKHLAAVPQELKKSWTELCMFGIASVPLINNLLGNSHTDIALKLLEATDLIIPMKQGKSDTGKESLLPLSYIVPYRLPIHVVKEKKRLYTCRYKFFFDFGYFYPEAVFLKLLAKFYRFLPHQKESLNRNGLSLYKDFWSISISNDIKCSLKITRRTASQNVIKVDIGSASESDKNAFGLVRWIDNMINHIRLKDFPFVSYSCGVKCHQCSNYFYGNKSQYHILALAKHGGTCEKKFPTSGELKFNCNGVPRTIIIPEGQLSCHIFLPREIPHKKVSTDGVGFDTLISTSEEDSAWVQCELLPVLENAETPFLIFVPHQKPTIAVRLTYQTDPNPGQTGQSAHPEWLIKREEINQCKCVVAVLSRQYCNNSRCMYELRYAIHLQKTVIPIITDSCRPPGCLSTVKCLDYQSCLRDGSLMRRFYLPLIMAVKSKAG